MMGSVIGQVEIVGFGRHLAAQSINGKNGRQDIQALAQCPNLELRFPPPATDFLVGKAGLLQFQQGFPAQFMPAPFFGKFLFQVYDVFYPV